MKKLPGIHEIRDESDRKGLRVVYELKNDAIPNVVLNLLYKYTALQTSFSVNNIALVHGRPEQLNLKDIIHHFVEHRHEVIVRRTQFELKKRKRKSTYPGRVHEGDRNSGCFRQSHFHYPSQC